METETMIMASIAAAALSVLFGEININKHTRDEDRGNYVYRWAGGTWYKERL